MSEYGEISLGIRALDVKRFVEAFKQEYGEWCDANKKIENEGDVLACVLGGIQSEDPDFDEEEGCWRAYGCGIVSIAWLECEVPDFFNWCAPYVDPATAYFSLTSEGDNDVYWTTNYKIEGGRMVPSGGSLVCGVETMEPPHVSEVIDFLKRRRPSLPWHSRGEYCVSIGLYGYGWDEIDACAEDAEGAEEAEDAEEAEEAEEALPADVQPGVVTRKLDNIRSARCFTSFGLHFKYTKKRGVEAVEFSGDFFDWDKYVVYDEGLTKEDLAKTILECVTINRKKNKKRRATVRARQNGKNLPNMS